MIPTEKDPSIAKESVKENNNESQTNILENSMSNDPVFGSQEN
jgi:hypothetical protein